jgi:hypothetical protein
MVRDGAGTWLAVVMALSACLPPLPSATNTGEAQVDSRKRPALRIEVGSGSVRVGDEVVRDGDAVIKAIDRAARDTTKATINVAAESSSTDLVRVFIATAAAGVTSVELLLGERHARLELVDGFAGLGQFSLTLDQSQTPVGQWIAPVAPPRARAWVAWKPGDTASDDALENWLDPQCSKRCDVTAHVAATLDLQQFFLALERLDALRMRFPELRLHFIGPVPAFMAVDRSAVSREVSGRLEPEVIQTIVRRSFSEFRVCYEDGLRRDAGLKGRINVRFVIGRDGKVQNAIDAGSSLPDVAVRDCVVKKFEGLVFPQPEGGIVTVIYPIMLAPG